MKEYALSLILTALICGLLPGLLSKGTAQELTKMACGLVLVLTAVGPLRNFDWDLREEWLLLPEDSSEVIAQGEDQAQKTMADIIKTETQAYILDKAAQLGAQVSVDVFLGPEYPPLPEAVTIRGTVPPETREALQEIICTQLGIAKENLTWTGET